MKYHRICHLLVILLITGLFTDGFAEKCTQCHLEKQRFSPFHSLEQMGCDRCHGGDPDSLNQDQAHYNMEAFPGRMATVEKSCGQEDCHKELIPLVRNSLMLTVDGMLSVTRRLYNEKSRDPTLQPLQKKIVGKRSRLIFEKTVRFLSSGDRP